MPATLYTTRLVIASLRNVPSQGYDVAYDNGVRIFGGTINKGQPNEQTFAGQRPELLVLTETWDERVKQGLRDAARHAGIDWHWHTESGQSAMLGWGAPWTYGLPTTRRGWSAGRIPFVTDRRDLLGVNVKRAGSDRRLVLEDVHTTPIPSRKAPLRVPIARASHQAAARRMNRLQRRIGYPMVFAGDWNTDRLLDPDLRIGPGITHAECFDGTNAAFGRSHAETFPLRSDHPGVVVDLRLVAA